MEMEKVEYAAIRTCNAGFAEGIKGVTARELLGKGQKSCPVLGERMIGQVEVDLGSANSHALELAMKTESLDLINGWCDDPCKLCGAHAADNGGINISW